MGIGIDIMNLEKNDLKENKIMKHITEIFSIKFGYRVASPPLNTTASNKSVLASKNGIRSRFSDLVPADGAIMSGL